jgi:predicted  nucleic acid-binding Zn-ribbon protein
MKKILIAVSICLVAALVAFGVSMSRLNSTRNELSTKTAQLDTANKEKQDVQDKLTAAETTLTETQTKLADTETVLTDTQTKLADAETTLTDTQTKLADAEQQLTEKTEALTAANASAEELQGRLTAAETSLADFQAKLEEAQKQIEELKEAAKEATVADFFEHVKTFLTSLNANEKDVNLSLVSAMLKLDVRVTCGVNGDVNGITFYQNGAAAGSLQWDSEAIYLSYGEQAYFVRLATLRQLLDTQALQEDLQKVIGLLQKMLPHFMDAYETTVEGDVTTIRLNGEKFSEGMAAAIDELVNDPEFAALVTKYAGLLGKTVDIEAIKTGWAEQRAQAVEIWKNMEVTMSVNQTTGEINMDVLAKDPATGATLMSMKAVTVAGSDGYTANVTMEAAQDGKTLKYDIAVVFNSTGYDYTAKIIANDQEILIREKIAMSPEGTPVSFDYSMAMGGQEVMAAHWEGNQLTVTANGSEYLNARVEGEKLYATIAGQIKLVGEIVEKDADHVKVRVTIDQGNGQTVAAELQAAIVKSDAGECLECTVSVSGMEVLKAQLYAADKQGFDLIRDKAEKNEITLEMIQQAIQGIFQSSSSGAIAQ